MTSAVRAEDLIIGITPFREPDARLAAAVSRAGGLGVLDLGAGDRRARDSLERLRRWAPAPFGVRVAAHCRIDPEDLTGAGTTAEEASPSHLHTVVLGSDSPWPIGEVPPEYRVLAEVTDLDQALDAVRAGAHGLIARGSEGGGRVGELSTFVLLQRLLADAGVDLPVWACGGIGPRTAAAAWPAARPASSWTPSSPCWPSPGCRRRRPRRCAPWTAPRPCWWPVTGYCAVAARTPPMTSDDPCGWPVCSAPRTAHPAAAGRPGRLPRRPLRRAARRHRARRCARCAPPSDAVRDDGPPARCAPAPREPGAGHPAARRPGPDDPGQRPGRASPRRSPTAAGCRSSRWPCDRPSSARRTLLDRDRRRCSATGPGASACSASPPRSCATSSSRSSTRCGPPARSSPAAGPPRPRPWSEPGITTYLHVPSPGLLGSSYAPAPAGSCSRAPSAAATSGPRASFPLWEAQLARARRVPGQPIRPPARSCRCSSPAASTTPGRRRWSPRWPRRWPRAGRPARRADGHRLPVHRGGGGARRGPAAVPAAGARPPSAPCCSRPRPATPPAALHSPFADDFHRTARPSCDGAGRAEPARCGRSWSGSTSAGCGSPARACARAGDVARAPVDEERQAAEGMYMIGQVAVLRDRDHHRRRAARPVTDGAADFHADRLDALRAPARAAGRRRRPAPAPLDIAIVGMACMFPGAPDLASLLGERPRRRRRRHRGPGRALGRRPLLRARGRTGQTGRITASKWGGFLDPRALRPAAATASRRPRSAASSRCSCSPSRSPAGRWPTPATPTGAEFDRARTSVVFGAEAGSDLCHAADPARHAARRTSARCPTSCDGAAARGSPRTPSPAC